MKSTKSIVKKKMFSLVEEQLRSGQPSPLFCSEHGIKPCVFKYWQKKYKAELSLDSPSFLPVEVTAPSAAFSFAAEIVYPSGVILRLQAATVSQLEPLLSLRVQ